jgi:hypothetical protein
MSIYHVNKVCYRAQHDPAFVEAAKRDPEGTLAALPLTDEERRLLLAGEVGKLYEMGAHPFLLGHLSRMGLFGLTAEKYVEKIRAVKEILP